MNRIKIRILTLLITSFLITNMLLGLVIAQEPVSLLDESAINKFDISVNKKMAEPGMIIYEISFKSHYRYNDASTIPLSTAGLASADRIKGLLLTYSADNNAYIFYDKIKTEVMISPPEYLSDYITPEPNKDIFCDNVVAQTASEGILNTLVGLIPIVGTLTNLGPTMGQILNCMPNHKWWGTYIVLYEKPDAFSSVEDTNLTYPDYILEVSSSEE